MYENTHNLTLLILVSTNFHLFFLDHDPHITHHRHYYLRQSNYDPLANIYSSMSLPNQPPGAPPAGRSINAPAASSAPSASGSTNSLMSSSAGEQPQQHQHQQHHHITHEDYDWMGVLDTFGDITDDV